MDAEHLAADFGAHLRRHREVAGLTQEELAERAGLTTKAVSALERGERRRPYPSTVRSLADALGLNDGERAAMITLVRAGAERSASEVKRKPSRDRSVRSDLPPQPTALLGRDEELTILREQLVDPEVRLLTLVGPGGVGKTILATAVARGLIEEGAVPDGTWFVDLSAVREAPVVGSTIARALGLDTSAAGGPLTGIERFVGEKRVLLVLDNFEQVLEASPDVGRLLLSCPRLTVLVTSRESLRLRWERLLPVGPLALPDLKHLPPLDGLSRVPSVALFLERARASTPSFALTSDNAPAVAQLCVRLDGLPLAIELVAARAAQLGAVATLERVARRLPIPGASMRDAPARQRSLRAAFQWSLDLLDDAELALFRRMSVFAGGWTIEAAEAVAGDDVPDVLTGLTSLADKHLVDVQVLSEQPGNGRSDGPRFRLLETAREVGLELLETAGEAEALGQRHAAYFAGLAERSAPQLAGAGQAATVVELEREASNFRETVRWVVEHDDDSALDLGLRLVAALGWYWFLHGYPAEAGEWLTRLVGTHPADGEGEPEIRTTRASALRAGALNAAGFRATDLGDYPAAQSFHEQALVISRELGDVDGITTGLHGHGDATLWLGDRSAARQTYDEGMALAESVGSSDGRALFAFHLGQLCWLSDDLEGAERYSGTAESIARSAGIPTWVPYALAVAGSVALERGDSRAAAERYQAALRLAWQIHDLRFIRVYGLPGLAAIAAKDGDARRAVRLAAAADALETTASISAFPPVRDRHERWLSTARQSLDAATQARLRSEAQAMPIDAVVADALRDDPAPVGSPPPATAAAALSPRESEVLALVAGGKSNREIAEALFVTEHTAKYHVASLFNKLGASTRAEAVGRAVALGLLTPPAPQGSR